MNKLLYLPGLLFLLVIFFRVILPLLKTPGWKRSLDAARYERAKKNFPSPIVLEKAVDKYTDQPAVYLEYYLNHSNAADLQNRFSVLLKGHERTHDTALAFFMGSAYLEEGDWERAEAILEQPDIKNYLSEKHIFLLPLLYMEKQDWQKAEEAFWDYHRINPQNIKARDESLCSMSAQDLLPLVLIQRARGKDWKQTMAILPIKSVHSDMSWNDYREQLVERLESLKEASTGIQGSPDRFNRRRRDFFNERLALVDEWIVWAKKPVP